MEQRANCDELDEDGESQWHHLERKFGSVNKERMLFCSSVSPTTRGIFVGHHGRTGAVLCSTKKGVV